MSVWVFDDALSGEDAKRVEEVVKKTRWRAARSRSCSPARYYPLELEKGLKFGDWEQQEAPNLHYVTKFSIKDSFMIQLFNGLVDKCDLDKIGVEEIGDCYIAGHKHGDSPHIHPDSNFGNMTLLYYPILDWDEKKWGGGTTIWNNEDDISVDEIDTLEVLKHATYKGNRLVVFDADHWHRAEPVARICKEMRYVVVFKSIADGGNTQRLNYYDN
jgi:hypothetical protein